MNKTFLAIALLFALCACSSNNNSDDTATTDSGSVDAGSADSGSTEVAQSCESVSVSDLQASGGVVITQLPSDLSAVGAQIVLDTMPEGTVVAFDANNASITLEPASSRLSTSVNYSVVNAENEVLASHEHQWVFSPVRVMPLGDSITSGIEYFDGVETPPMAERVGYRKFLYDQLLADGYTIDYLGQGGQSAGAAAGLADPENNGYPGVDIDFINAKLIEQLTEDTADIILLHIGTNNTPANAQGIDDWLDALDAWELDNQPVMALVATIVPKRDPALNEVVDQFNTDLRARVAARTNDKVFLVEQNQAVSVNELSSEAIGIHPSAAGYEKMAAAWYDGLLSSDALSKCE